MVERETIFERIRVDAFEELFSSQRIGTNLSLAQRVIERGETVGPPHYKVKADRPSILVFADDDPHANFSHPCRYLFYDAKTAKSPREVGASSPPIASAKKPLELIPFHEPVPFLKDPVVFRPVPFLRCPVLRERPRWAI